MADKYDKLLKEYFSGLLNNKIYYRMEELENHKEADENIGGGKAQNTYNNPVETKLIKFENDEKLQDLISKRDQLDAIMCMLPEEHAEVLSQLYRRKWTVDNVALVNHVSKKTLYRWKDNLKELVDAYNLLDE